MTKRRGIGLVALTSAAVIGLSVLGTGTAVAGGGSHGGGGSGNGDAVVYAKGLNNPRQLSFTPSGDLLIAEAGAGAVGTAEGDPYCFDGPEDGTVCFGDTGAVTKVDRKGTQSRILTHLPSIANKDVGTQASGPSDVYGDGRTLSILIGLGGSPETRSKLPDPGGKMGKLVRTSDNGKHYSTIADLAAYEAKTNPIHDIDSNPVGLLYSCGDFVVADAGGNTVIGVPNRGNPRTLAVLQDLTAISPGFPDLPPAGDPIPAQAVPTSVAIGSDGAYYISQLTGFPFQKGLANIYRLDPRKPKAEPTVWASGLTNVTDLAFNGKDLYAVQISNDGLLSGVDGSVVKVHRGSANPDIVKDGLFAPYGIAIRNGYAYVTTGSVAPGAGQVMKFKL